MSLELTPTGIADVLLIQPRVFNDARGFFQEVYHWEKYQAAGVDCTFVQDNWSRSSQSTLRGLHYQLRFPQAKLVSVIQGAILDVAVDIRQGSPTFGQSVAQELSSENHAQLFVPEGFAHGFCVLSETADVLYKCNGVYQPNDDYGIAWNDPALGIDWPIQTPILSEKDQRHPFLDAAVSDLLPLYRG
ncbi:MAG: dTDP-4-dehydrorhamnose 3,5-epimerase [Kiritimatiellia bacterium]|jgi:dTDP-4-dehydrorhamnose 3,5-epimerase